MKTFTSILLLFLSCFSIAHSQERQRVLIKGNILVENNDIEGITIYNTTSSQGTISDENGEFFIEVALNDLLQIRALEYNNFDVIVNEEMIQSKRLRIYLIEKINTLEEIVIKNRTLTGNIETDAKNINVFRPKMDAIYFALENDQSLDPTIENIAVSTQGRGLTNGLNVTNIVDQLLLPLFRSEATDKEKKGIPNVPPQSIKYYFGATFISENFNIPEYRVEEFVRYVEDENFDYDLLNYGRELEFLQLLDEKSKEFLKK